MTGKETHMEKTSNLHIAYGDKYLDWKLGKNHPTNAERARIATNMLIKRLGDNVTVIDPTVNDGDIDSLSDIHSADYVRKVLEGISDEWSGVNPVLGSTALAMFAGTARLTERMISGEITLGFNPQGAKHHAQYDYASGFCVFNDMAWAAKKMALAGMRVMYIDWDAHHGDGVEALLFDTDIVTCSIHEGGIYPGTGNEHFPTNAAYNWPLSHGAGTDELRVALEGIRNIAYGYRPDVVLLATGADAHETDPLSSLTFDYDDYSMAASTVVDIAHVHAEGRVLIGGAGGYQALTHTPRVWAQVVSEIYAGV
jgi:acetoin utilization protein AcuC